MFMNLWTSMMELRATVMAWMMTHPAVDTYCGVMCGILLTVAYFRLGIKEDLEAWRKRRSKKQVVES